MNRIINRFAWILVVVWASITLTFVLARLVPADPARLAAGLEAGPEQVAEVRKLLGLDKPLILQYFNYFFNIVQFDLGTSIQTRQPVVKDVLYALPPTLELVFISFFIYVVLSFTLGVLWSRFSKGLLSLTINIITILGSSMPVFWLAIIFQLFFAGKLLWFPIAGNLNYDTYGIKRITGAGTLDSLIQFDFPAFQSALLALVLPVSSLVITMLPVAIRLTKSTMDVELSNLYIRTARSRGFSESKIFFSEALKMQSTQL